MDRRFLRPLAALFAGTLAIAACASAEETSPSLEAEAVAAPGADTAAAQRCSTDETVAGDIPGWPLAAGAEPRFVPLVASSLLTEGRNRFLYNVLDASYQQVAAPDLASRVDFYAIERDPDTPAAQADAEYLEAGPGRGLYRTPIDFDCVGEWGAEVFVQEADGTWAGQRLRFAVHHAGSTPAIGAEVPLSDSLTASNAEEVALISSDTDPYLPAYDKSVAETATSGRPSLVFFATPAFCQTGYCGPTVELVKDVAREHEAELEYVNVEPYELHLTENGLQPELTEEGHLQPVDAAIEWGIPVEPYLFLLDADGRVFAKFEGLVGDDELRAAVADVLGA
jgi:hypothetical protein